MSFDHQDLSSLFSLHPLKEAKVSEISENTASSPLPPEDRVNFHIGHPIQDERLSDLYGRLVVGADVQRERGGEQDFRRFVENAGWDQDREDLIPWILKTVAGSSAYLPRGGFNRSHPSRAAVLVRDWLVSGQDEPLEYDLGRDSGRKELIFTSGGAREALRIVLHTLSRYLIHRPARVLLWRTNIPGQAGHYPGLLIEEISHIEDLVLQVLDEALSQDSVAPVFFCTGASYH